MRKEHFNSIPSLISPKQHRHTISVTGVPARDLPFIESLRCVSEQRRNTDVEGSLYALDFCRTRFALE